MQSPDKRLRNIIIVGVVVFVLIGIGLTIASILSNQNPYGKAIKIQNYSAKVKNLSKDYENNISSALYDIVNLNREDEFEGRDVKDAFIRDSSEVQNEALANVRYQGSFIVDIASLEQSYKVQYSYSTRENDPFIAGYPILLSCVDKADVKYENFDCKDLVSRSEESDGTTVSDPLINSLPYSTLSYGLLADTTSGSLVLKAELRIPESDLRGDLGSKQEVVRNYKRMVTDFIRTRGFDPAKYTIDYNYTDNGDKISTSESFHGPEVEDDGDI